MIVSFKIKNYRSYADEAELSFKAQPGDLESNAVKEVILTDGAKTHLLPVAAIFGANAAGKSNVIYALSALSDMVSNSLSYKVSDGLSEWTPYFSPEMYNQPIELYLDFIVENSRYIYGLQLSHMGVMEEKLALYYGKEPKLVFRRQLNKDSQDNPLNYILEVGEGWKSTSLDLSDMNLLGNQLMLSWLATKEANGLQHVADYIGSLQVLIPDKLPSLGRQINNIAENIFKLKENNGKTPLFRRFTKIMKIADLGITDAYMGYHDDSDFQFPPSVSSDIQKAFINDNRWEFELVHKIGDGSNSLVRLPLRYESQGTQMLVKLTPHLLKALDEGSFLAYDEISTAMHPSLLKLLVNLFQNPKSNPKGAQLLFTTHDASIVSEGTLRADQIWFAEKKNGKSELYSAQDFDGVSINGIPFENWYRAGRFGALPSFGNVDYIFESDGKDAQK